MALNESAVEELLDAIAVEDGTDLIRELARWALQQLIENEASVKIGPGCGSARGAGHASQRAPAPGAVDDGRRPGVGDPEAAQRLVLS